MKEKAVLIVDDNISIIQSFTHLFRRFGFLTETASDGIQAVEIIKAGKIDLVIMDLDMPYKGGLEALVEIKELRPNIPIIILTAQDSKEVKVRALEAGANIYFTKPVDTKILERYVYKLLELL